MVRARRITYISHLTFVTFPRTSLSFLPRLLSGPVVSSFLFRYFVLHNVANMHLFHVTKAYDDDSLNVCVYVVS